MSIARFYYDPFTEFDRLFDDAFTARFPTAQQRQLTQTQSENATRAFKPRMDLHENTQNNTVTATFELPGLKKEDISIDLHNARLTIAGETKTSSEHSEDGYAVRERSYGSFSRTLQLPSGIKTDEIKASMENGILTVTFPKTSPQQPSQRITIA